MSLEHTRMLRCCKNAPLSPEKSESLTRSLQALSPGPPLHCIRCPQAVYGHGGLAQGKSLRPAIRNNRPRALRRDTPTGNSPTFPPPFLLTFPSIPNGPDAGTAAEFPSMSSKSSTSTAKPWPPTRSPRKKPTPKPKLTGKLPRNSSASSHYMRT